MGHSPHHHRARVAALTRSRADGDPDLAQARHDLAVANTEAAVAKAIATAPPLTREQVDRLTAIIAGARS